jgi:hypothetical protein
MDDQTDRATRPSSDEGQARARYDRDVYSWAIEQAALLRAGRIAEADVLNIAEEIDDVGNEQYDKLESAIRIILLHLLKWDYQPRQRSRSWHLSVQVQRKHAQKVMRKNLGLKPLVDEAIVEAYEVARLEAAGETLLELDTFPHDCPYSRDDILERDIPWPPRD